MLREAFIILALTPTPILDSGGNAQKPGLILDEIRGYTYLVTPKEEARLEQFRIACAKLELERTKSLASEVHGAASIDYDAMGKCVEDHVDESPAFQDFRQRYSSERLS